MHIDAGRSAIFLKALPMVTFDLRQLGLLALGSALLIGQKALPG